VITLVAIDPGTTESAFVAMSGRQIVRFGKVDNEQMLRQLDFEALESDNLTALVVEMVASYGMPVGASVFNTCVWIGRFVQLWGRKHHTVFRKTVTAHLCGTVRADDSNVRAALIEKYGGKVAAIGSVKAKGPLHGVTGDVWSALAVAVTFLERADVGSGLGLLR